MKVIYKLLLIYFLFSCYTEAQYHSIMSYNIKYDNQWDKNNSWESRKKYVAKLFVEYAPTIIGIQEGLINQVQFIDSCLINYDYIGVGRDDGREQGEFCAIYFDTTQYVITSHSTFWLSDTPDSISIGWDAALERICTYGLLVDKDTKEKFWVFNTHFDHLGFVAREKSSMLILEKIHEKADLSLPIILMGDFNSIIGSPPINLILKELNDALQISLEELKGPSGTFNGFNLDLPIEKRIDYIFTKNFAVQSYVHIDDRLKNNSHISDHLPVLIQVEFR